MLEQELLQTLAELSVTMAALSAVAGVVKQEAINTVSSGLLRDVAIIGMLVALYSLLPLVFWNEGAPAIKVCAIAALITWLAGYAVYLRGVFRDRSQISTAFWLGMLITACGMALLAVCLFSGFDTALRFYLLALLAWLAIAGLNFVASVFSGAAHQK